MAAVQIRDLFDPQALSASEASGLTVPVWVTAGLFYLVSTYPFQPVVFPWLGPWPQATYVVLCLAGIATMFCFGGAGFGGEYRKRSIIAIALLLGTMTVTLVRYKNPTVVRDMLLLAFIVVLFFRTRGTANLRIIRALTYICVAFLVPAMIVVSMFNAGLLDEPSWSVDRMGFAPGNPLLNRQTWADGEFFLPWSVAVVVRLPVIDQGFGLHFTRQPLVFIEPTDTWYYTAALFWFAVTDVKMAARGFCLVILGIALIVSFSVAGILGTVGAGLICGAMRVGGRKLVLLLIVGVGLLISSVPLDHLIALLGSNKADQFHYYKENVTVFSTLSLFGNPASDDQVKSYGALVVLYRYGVIGAAVMLVVVLGIAAAAFSLLSDRAVLGWRRIPLFVGSFVSLVVLIKYPGIIPVMPALCLAGTLSYRQTRLDPFTLSLVR